MDKGNWLEISNQLRRIHPVMEKKITTFEDTLDQAANAAKACDPEGVYLGIDACKLSIALCSDIEHLMVVGIISKDGLKEGVEEYSADRFRDIFIKFSACLSKEVESEIMSKLIERASELSPEWQQRLVSFALEVRQLETGRQSCR
ncbi:hypothetical protein LCGC14_1630970 [marine sediment metagenome]|uniref:Uncharacterized protein n=1 Tax=marine sediment metagenome TaxID=412755 RepID=A0A0F9I2N1_9ZZZZ